MAKDIIPNNIDSVRTEFAKAAMQALVMRGGFTSDRRLAKRAFEIADAMVNHIENDGEEKKKG